MHLLPKEYFIPRTVTLPAIPECFSRVYLLQHKAANNMNVTNCPLWSVSMSATHQSNAVLATADLSSERLDHQEPSASSPWLAKKSVN